MESTSSFGHHPRLTPLFIEEAEKITLQSEEHTDIALIIQPSIDDNGAFSSVCPTSDLKELSSVYKLRFKTVSTISDLQKAIEETSLEGAIKIVWIRAHGSPEYIAFGDGDEDSDSFFHSFKAFTEERYDKLFEKVDLQASIILSACQTGNKTNLERDLEGDQELNSGETIEIQYQKDTTPLSLSKKFGRIVIHKNEKKVSVPSLNVASALAFLLPERRIYAPTEDTLPKTDRFLFDNFAYPLRLRGTSIKPFIVFEEKLLSVRHTKGGIAFTIDVPNRFSNKRVRSLMRLNKTDYNKKEVLAFLKQGNRVVWTDIESPQRNTDHFEETIETGYFER